MVDITPKFKKVSAQKKEKKVEKPVEFKPSESPLPQENSVPGEFTENSIPEFPDEFSGSESSGNDIHVCFSTPARNSKSKGS